MAIVSCWSTRVNTVYVLFSLRATLQTLPSSWPDGLSFCVVSISVSVQRFRFLLLHHFANVSMYHTGARLHLVLPGLIILTTVIHCPSLT